MDSDERATLEKAIRDAWARGDLRAAANVAVRGYGPQIFGFLVAMNRSEEDGAEAFAVFSEDLWRGIADFSWQCSFRTWAYTLARHASARLSEGRVRRDRRHVELTDNPELMHLAASVRTETMSFLRTETKTKVAELRDALPEEDKALLILRVDRGLAWSELARVFMPLSEAARDGVSSSRKHRSASGEVTELALKREAARLRKRYQLVKERLLIELGRARTADRGPNS